MEPSNQTDQLPPNQPASKRAWPSWKMIAISAVILVALGVMLFAMLDKRSNNGSGNNNAQTDSSQAADTLYDALANAASQPRLRVGMYRETFANKADADARQNPGSIMSAVSELDTTTAAYRSVFTNNYFHAPGFDVGRCIDGTTYNQNYQADSQRATSLKEVHQHLKLMPEGHLYQVTQPLVFVPCSKAGIIPGSAPDLATARLSDGIFPVTLSRQQAGDWKQKIAAAELFTAKDEGPYNKNGKTLRKISLTPKQETGVNQRLFDIFYQAAEIETIKDRAWQHGFIAINPGNTGSIGGYYLIDERTRLPVYSELYGLNADKKTGESPAAGKNIARTKQNYSFPDSLTINLDTSLDFIE